MGTGAGTTGTPRDLARGDHLRTVRHRPPRVPRWLRSVLSIAALAVVVWRVVVPELADGRQTFESLQHASPVLVLLALVLELASLAAYSALTATVLGARHPPYATLLGIDLTGLGVSHVVPGGGATAAALRFRLLVSAGTRREDALSAAAIETTGSNLVLGALFGVGLVLSLTAFSDNLYYRSAATVVLVFLVLAAVSGWLLVRETEPSVRLLRAAVRRMPLVSESWVESFVRTTARRLTDLLTHPGRMGLALLLAGANWLLDAAALWIVLAAFGEHVHVGALLTVYGLGNLLPLIPLTPGGIGIVEGVMVSALVSFGVGAAPAVLGVLAWRLLEFWMPIPLAGAAYLSLRLAMTRMRSGAER